MRDAIEQFRTAIHSAGLRAPEVIEADGELHRFASNGKRDDDAGWYVFHANGIAAGAFGDWRTGISVTWKQDIGRKLAPIEAQELSRRMADATARREADQAKRHAEARARAIVLWKAAKLADPAHPYLVAKGVQAYGLRQEGDELIIPMRDVYGELHSLQTIVLNREPNDKLFLKGGRVTGCYYAIGKPNGALCIAEGYATGASIHEATGRAVAVAFDAGNLEPVAKALRVKYPTTKFIICADDDYRTEGNPGITKATEAARAVGGLLAIPDFGDDRPDGATDFNDLHCHRGAEAVERAVANARAPEAPEHQPDATDATARDPERPVFRTVTMIELVNAELPAREPLLAPWLCAQGLAQVHAWRGTGKTHFSLGVAYAVAAGAAFLGWQAPAARRVLFLDGEMPAVALKERLAAILAADTRDRDIPGDNLRFITPDLLAGAPPDLGIAEDQAALQDVIAEYDPALIVVDNISALVRSGAGENDAESWLPVQTWALRMRREGRAVLFVHHSGKTGRQRGTSKREDVLDTVLALKRPEPYDPADGARFTVEFEKARHVRGEDARAFEAHLTTDEHGRQLWTTRTLDDSTFDRVVALYHDGLTGVRDIAAELGVNASTVSRTLKKAKAIGVIEPDKGR